MKDKLKKSERKLELMKGKLNNKVKLNSRGNLNQ